MHSIPTFLPHSDILFIHSTFIPDLFYILPITFRTIHHYHHPPLHLPFYIHCCSGFAARRCPHPAARSAAPRYLTAPLGAQVCWVWVGCHLTLPASLQPRFRYTQTGFCQLLCLPCCPGGQVGGWVPTILIHSIPFHSTGDPVPLTYLRVTVGLPATCH